VRKSIGTREHAKLASLLRDLREEAGLSQKELGALLDAKQSFVSRMETGQRRMDLVELSTIARALGSSLADIVRRFER